VRGFFATLAVACSLVGGVAGVAWGVQVVSLPAPARNDRIVAATVAWFFRFRLVESDFQIDGGRLVHSACVQGQLPVTRGRELERASVLVFGDGRAVVDAQPPLRVIGVRGGEPGTLPLVQLELGGCSRVLGPLLAALVQNERIRIRRTVVAGEAALAVRFGTPRTRITIFVTPKTFEPFAVAVASHRFSGQARIRLLPLTPNRLQAILLRAGL
jgi:hypothetical protein